MIIVKLGGSVITDKSKDCSFKENVMDNLSKEIKKSNKKIMLVHGAGSFGHINAKKFKLNQGYKEINQLHGFATTLENVQRLNSMVLKSLQKNDINAISIPPHSILTLSNHKLSQVNYEFFTKYLELNFTPVTFGDVVIDEKLSFSICSGDLLVMALSKYFKPDKVIFVIDEDGIFSSNPKIDKNAKILNNISTNQLDSLTFSKDNHADVTGGMKGKIETIKNISKLGIDTILLNGNKPGRLYKILIGEETESTVIKGDKNE